MQQKNKNYVMIAALKVYLLQIFKLILRTKYGNYIT